MSRSASNLLAIWGKWWCNLYCIYLRNRHARLTSAHSTYHNDTCSLKTVVVWFDRQVHKHFVTRPIFTAVVVNSNATAVTFETKRTWLIVPSKVNRLKIMYSQLVCQNFRISVL